MYFRPACPSYHYLSPISLSSPHELSDAAQNPLTFQEKKSLISKIHQLPASKMQQVVDIIKDAIPPEKRGEGDEIEIPLDELDTFTLRKLQSFVEVSRKNLLQLLLHHSQFFPESYITILYYYVLQEHNTANAKKKSNVATKEGAVGSRKPRKEKAAPVDRAPGSSSAPKKAISNSSSVSVSGLYATGAHSHGSPGDDQHTGGDMMDSIEEDDMFFSNESFDDLRAQAAENGNSDASGQ